MAGRGRWGAGRGAGRGLLCGANLMPASLGPRQGDRLILQGAPWWGGGHKCNGDGTRLLLGGKE